MQTARRAPSPPRRGLRRSAARATATGGLGARCGPDPSRGDRQALSELLKRRRWCETAMRSGGGETRCLATTGGSSAGARRPYTTPCGLDAAAGGPSRRALWSGRERSGRALGRSGSATRRSETARSGLEAATDSAKPPRGLDRWQAVSERLGRSSFMRVVGPQDVSLDDDGDAEGMMRTKMAMSWKWTRGGLRSTTRSRGGHQRSEAATWSEAVSGGLGALRAAWIRAKAVSDRVE